MPWPCLRDAVCLSTHLLWIRLQSTIMQHPRHSYSAFKYTSYAPLWYISLRYHWCVLRLRGILRAFASACACWFFFLFNVCRSPPSPDGPMRATIRRGAFLRREALLSPGFDYPGVALLFLHSFIHSIFLYSYRIVEKATRLRLPIWRSCWVMTREKNEEKEGKKCGELN